MKKILVQFDGSNFYNKVKKISPKTHLSKFDYAGLCKYLAQNSSMQINYYIGEIKRHKNSSKSEKLYAGQQILFATLMAQDINIKPGFLLLSNGAYHEKGVDVQMACDIIYGALKNTYDICYLISSDTDLIPAIKIAQAEKKKIVYVGFEGFISRAMSNNCSSRLILKKKELEKFQVLSETKKIS